MAKQKIYMAYSIAVWICLVNRWEQIYFFPNFRMFYRKISPCLNFKAFWRIFYSRLIVSKRLSKSLHYYSPTSIRCRNNNQIISKKTWTRAEWNFTWNDNNFNAHIFATEMKVGLLIGHGLICFYFPSFNIHTQIPSFECDLVSFAFFN